MPQTPRRARAANAKPAIVACNDRLTSRAWQLLSKRAKSEGGRAANLEGGEAGLVLT